MSCSQYNRPRKENYMDWFTEVGRSVQSDHNTQSCDKQLYPKGVPLRCNVIWVGQLWCWWRMRGFGFWCVLLWMAPQRISWVSWSVSCFYVQVWCGVAWWCGSWCEVSNHFSTFLSSQSLPDIEGCLSCSLEMVVSLSVCIHEGWLSVCESHPEIL
jgi:hypothetical protein